MMLKRSWPLSAVLRPILGPLQTAMRPIDTQPGVIPHSRGQAEFPGVFPCQRTAGKREKKKNPLSVAPPGEKRGYPIERICYYCLNVKNIFLQKCFCMNHCKSVGNSSRYCSCQKNGFPCTSSCLCSSEGCQGKYQRKAKE